MGEAMRQRSRAGGLLIKARRRKAVKPKRRNAPKAIRSRGVYVAGQETVVARLTRERDEALLRETANSEILRLISKSPGDLELVFRTILEHATSICNANFGTLYRFDGKRFHPAAQFNMPRAFLEEQARRGPFEPRPGSPIDRVMRTRKVFHSADIAAEPVPGLAAELGGARSLVAVPMLKDDQLLGVIIIYRHEVRPFTDKQIELVQNFASQAVIAIENARLLNELRQRTTDLGEALEQQTATSEVLRTISTSAGALTPVFEAMLDKAMQLWEAAFGGMWTLEAGRYTAVALRGVPQPYAAFLAETTLVPGPGTAPYRFLHGERFVHNIDLASEEAYGAGDPQRRALVDLGGARTAVQVPLCKDESVLGVITIYRQEVRPFTDKQIALVQNFAAQAVIAIENTRLLNELRQRTTDLSASLEQQTATSEVLRVISSSQGELHPVFEAMLANAVRLCEAKFGTLYLREGDGFRVVALHGAPLAYAEERKRH